MSNFNFSKNKDIIYFVGKLAILFAVFHISQNIPLTEPLWKSIEQLVIKNIVWGVGIILNIFGFVYTTSKVDCPMYESDCTIAITGSGGVAVHPPCLAIELMFAFFALIFAYPGNWKSKLVVIPSGIITIHILNIIRVFGLVILSKFKKEWLDFSHHYIFQFTIVSLIFVLFAWWSSKYGENIFAKNKENEAQ